jgi:hypothetical protein
MGQYRETVRQAAAGSGQIKGLSTLSLSTPA